MYWKKYLKQSSGIIGIVIGILGICLSIYFYKKSIAKPEPILLTDPSKTLIVNAEHLSDTTLKIVRADGNDVVGDVTAIRFYFWNNGNKSIKVSNILEPINISLNDPNAVILDYKILKTSRKVVAPRLMRNVKSTDNSLSIFFNILEKDDGITGQIIYNGDQKTDLVVSGTIEDAKKILTNSDLTKGRFLWKTFHFQLVLLLVGLVFVFIAFLFILIIEIYRYRKGSEKVLSLMITVFLFALVSVSLTVAVISSIENLKTGVIYAMVKNVPNNIIP